MSYNENTAARLGRHALTLTPAELGRMFTTVAEKRLVVRQAPGRAWRDGHLVVATRSREILRAHVNRDGLLALVGLVDSPWGLQEVRLFSLVQRRLAMFLHHSKRGPLAGVSWHKVVKIGVEVLEARRPGVTLGSIEPHGGAYALFINGEKCGSSHSTASRVKQNTPTHFFERSHV